jgi:glucose-1-phosphate thymidylyltransferase
MNNVKVSSFGYVANSIIGEGVSVGPGFIAESGETRVAMDDALMKANIGAIIGDNTEVAGRVLVKPGKIVGVRCRIGWGAIVRENVPDNTRAL